MLREMLFLIGLCFKDEKISLNNHSIQFDHFDSIEGKKIMILIFSDRIRICSQTFSYLSVSELAKNGSSISLILYELTFRNRGLKQLI